MELAEKKSLQFELWQECGPTYCTYCYIGKNNRCTPNALKLDALNKALNFLNDEEKMIPYNTLSFIGGEFFQGQLCTPEIKNKFFDLMRKTAELQISGKIKEVWLMCTLTRENQEDLYTSLEILNNMYKEVNKPELMSQVWIVTSYDTIGRFHTQKMHDTWDYNMKHIRELYPTIHFNTCTILTQDLITKYLNDEWSFHNFMNTYNTAMFFKQPSPGSTPPAITNGTDLELLMSAKQEMEKIIPGFFPKREDFLRFLMKFKEDCPELYVKLFNIQYRADDLYRNFNEEDKRMMLNHRAKNKRSETDTNDGSFDTKTAPCGHQINYSAYIDSNECMICDREFIRDQF